MAPYLRPHRRGGQGSARSRPANHLYYSMTSLLSHLRTHLARTHLLGEPGVALVAVSGGADSVALLDLLHTLTPELGLSLVVAHVDHGIRSDSGTVARAVGELAERYELPFEVGELTLGPDATETVARRARYAWLGEVQRRHGARYLVTAHHRDDQVETILLRLLKGSAPAGLSRYDDVLSAALLRAAARRSGLVLGVRRARQLVELTRRPTGRRLPLGDGWMAEVAFDRLRVTRAVRDAAVEVVPTGERGSAVFGEFRVAWTPDPAPARLPRAEWTTWIAGANWEVRPPRPGDRLVPLGGIGRRPLRRMLMEARVPRSDRPGYPVVARGETILWVPGICRSADDLPRPGTRAVRVDVTKHGEPQADGRA